MQASALALDGAIEGGKTNDGNVNISHILVQAKQNMGVLKKDQALSSYSSSGTLNRNARNTQSLPKQTIVQKDPKDSVK